MINDSKILPGEVNTIIDLFSLFLKYYVTGLSCFFNENVPFPCTYDLAALVAAPYKSDDLGVRINKSLSNPEAQSMIERTEPIHSLLNKYGGLETFRKAFKEYQQYQPERAHVLEDLSQVGGMRYNTMEYVADKHHTSVRNLWNIRKTAMIQIAMDIYAHHSTNNTTTNDKEAHAIKALNR